MKDIWARAIEAGHAGDDEQNDARRARGRVLRVKGGYNPNSSSVGSAIPTFLTIAAGTGALAVVLLNALGVVGRLLRQQTEAEPPGAPADEPSSPGQDEDDG